MKCYKLFFFRCIRIAAAVVIVCIGLSRLYRVNQLNWNNSNNLVGSRIDAITNSMPHFRQMGFIAIADNASFAHYQVRDRLGTVLWSNHFRGKPSEVLFGSFSQDGMSAVLARGYNGVPRTVEVSGRFNAFFDDNALDTLFNDRDPIGPELNISTYRSEQHTRFCVFEDQHYLLGWSTKTKSWVKWNIEQTCTEAVLPDDARFGLSCMINAAYEGIEESSLSRYPHLVRLRARPSFMILHSVLDALDLTRLKAMQTNSASRSYASYRRSFNSFMLTSEDPVFSRCQELVDLRRGLTNNAVDSTGSLFGTIAFPALESNTNVEFAMLVEPKFVGDTKSRLHRFSVDADLLQISNVTYQVSDLSPGTYRVEVTCSTPQLNDGLWQWKTNQTTMPNIIRNIQHSHPDADEL